MNPRTRTKEQRNGGHEGKVIAPLFKELMGGHLPMLGSYRHENGKIKMPVPEKKAKDPREEGPMPTPLESRRRMCTDSLV